MKNTYYNEGRIRQEIWETTYLVAGYVALAGYMKYHNGICTEELFGIRKNVAVKVWKEQMVSSYNTTSSSESLQTSHSNIESTSYERKMSCNKPGK